LTTNEPGTSYTATGLMSGVTYGFYFTSYTSPGIEGEETSVYSATTTTPSQTFSTPGTFSFTVPPGVTSLTAETWGGGGSGDDGAYGLFPGGGGGGGGYNSATFAVTAGHTVTVHVAVGGVAPSGGGDTSYVVYASVTYASAQGGSPGVSNAAGGGGTGTYNGGNGASATFGGAYGGGGGGGAGSGGAGGNATAGTGGAGGIIGGGGGAGGVGGNGGTASANATAGSVLGGGGGGGYKSAPYAASANGADGQVKLSW